MDKNEDLVDEMKGYFQNQNKEKNNSSRQTSEQVLKDFKDYKSKDSGDCHNEGQSLDTWRSKDLLGPRLLGDILDCDYSTKDVKKTKYYGANIRALLEEFNKEDFSKKDINEIAVLCSEINQRVSKALGIKPSETKIVDLPNLVNVVSSSVGSNCMCIEKNAEASGLDYLFNTFKASYMSYLDQNKAKLASGQNFDKFAIVNDVQEAVLAWDEGVSSVLEKKRDLRNLENLESELFAYENMINLKNKGLEFNQKAIKNLQKSKNLAFPEKIFDENEREKIQDRLKDGYHNIKKVYNKNKIFSPKGARYCLDRAFSELKEEDFDAYFKDLGSKISDFQRFKNQELASDIKN